MGESIWKLFVDESGNFDLPEEAVIVAGLLIPEGTGAYPPLALRDALQDSAEGRPWPPHTRLLERPVMHALWPMAAAHRGHGAASGPALEACRLLEARSPDAFRKALANLLQGGEPEFEDVKSLERALRAVSRPTLRALEAARTRAETNVRAVLRLMGEAGTRLVAAGEAMDGDAWRTTKGTPDRYLTLLACVLSRSADALLRLEGDHQVEIHVLTRYVYDPALDRAMPMTLQRVEEASEMATGAADRQRARGGSTVRLEPKSLLYFDGSVCPEGVMADFAAFHSRHSLATHRSLPIVRETIEAFLGIPVSFDAPELPHTAASGFAHDHIERARTGGLSSPEVAAASGPLADSLVRAWAREQAVAWAQEVAGRR